MKKTVLPLLALRAAAAQAHEGQGLPGAAHGHAADAASRLAIALLAGLFAGWRGRR